MPCKLDHTSADQWVPLFLCRVCSPVSTTRDPETPAPPSAPDPVQVRQAELRAAHDLQRKAKRAQSLAKLQDKHAFEKWDDDQKAWVRDEAKINAHHVCLLTQQSDNTDTLAQKVTILT